MKHHQPLRENSRAKKAFEYLLKGLEGPLTMSFRPLQVSKYGLDGYLRILDEKERRLRLQAFKRLRQKKLFRIRRMGKRYELALTQAGLYEAARVIVFQAEPCDPGMMSIIIFDVPETQRYIRDQLRRFLKEVGYFSLQRSVWVSPINAGEEIMQLFRASGAQGWVRAYLAQEQGFIPATIVEGMKPAREGGCD